MMYVLAMIAFINNNPIALYLKIVLNIVFVHSGVLCEPYK